MNPISNHPLFSVAYNKFQQAARDYPLSIIMLGPGEGSVGYGKRKQLKEHLNSSSGHHYDVAFVEDLPEVDIGRPINDPMEKIAFYIANADVIFALTVDDKSVTGVLTEINRFRSDRAFLEKTFIILPERFSSKKRSKRFPLIWEIARIFLDDQKYEYTQRQFEDCNVIRDWIMKKAKTVGLKAKFKEFLRERGISPPNPY